MNETIRNNLQYLIDKHGDMYDAYTNYGKQVHTGGPLDDKTIWLIKVAISASNKLDYALATHIKKALDAGNTREEIEHVILLTAPTVGFPNMMESMLVLRQLFGETD
ncbi:MAG: carboxymuconolactone decarboxylase family protein [Tissierellia bacterium]|jgi:AhpD family alkylhydroperoxidase|nr:carboxymuconolactone decarboxylase family protein [Tissierellia bacterium]